MRISTNTLLCAGALTMLGVGCGSTMMPPEYATAERQLQLAKSGEAGRRAPAELLIAERTLGEAQRAHEDDPDSTEARDLAYISIRQTLIAEAHARSIAISEASAERQAAYQRDLEEAHREARLSAQDQPAAAPAAAPQPAVPSATVVVVNPAVPTQAGAPSAPPASQPATVALPAPTPPPAAAPQPAPGSAAQASQPAQASPPASDPPGPTPAAPSATAPISGNAARVAADARAAESMRRLSALTSVRESRTRTIITIPGAVLFPATGAELLLSAAPSLTATAEVLNAQPTRTVVVEGFTHSADTASSDVLARERAESVRAFLVSQGVDQARVRALGTNRERAAADGPVQTDDNGHVEIVLGAVRAPQRPVAAVGAR